MPRGSGYSLRPLKSGRVQLLLPDPATGKFIGSGSYPDDESARQAGRVAAGEQSAGTWFDPRRGEVLLRDYLPTWLEAKRMTGRHSARHSAESARLVEAYILPVLGVRQLVELRPPVIRAWYDALTASQRDHKAAAAQASRAKASEATRQAEAAQGLANRYPTDGAQSSARTAAVKASQAKARADKAAAAADGAGLVPAKAYRLLSAALGQAARDELIPKNPCHIQGAGVEATKERALLEPGQVQELADAMGERWHAMILVAGWCGLRFGELVGLRRRHFDLAHQTITVEGAIVQLGDGTFIWKAPKTAAGRRTVVIPSPLVEVIEAHLERFAEPGPDGYVFVGPKGGLQTSANFGRLWRKARAEVGVEASFHDLRHAAGTLAAQTGATAREVQRRLGHASPDAAHRYQHAAERREKDLADRLGAMMPEGGLAHRSRKPLPPPRKIGS